MDAPDLDAEHQRLLRTTDDLEREHEGLHARPHDHEAHIAHRERLRQHIQDLHAHIDQLKARDRQV